MIAVSQFFRVGNHIESGLWIAIGAGFAVRATIGGVSRVTWVAAVTFVVFGLSDIVEAETGAWWKPWWLLVWKGGCLLVFLWLLMLHVHKKRKNSI